MITGTYDFTSLLTHAFNTSFVDMTCDLGRGTFWGEGHLGGGTFWGEGHSG